MDRSRTIHTRRPLTQTQRQQIIDLRREPHTHTYNQIAKITGRPYNTIAGVCRAAHLQHNPTRTILIVHDPAGVFKLGPTELNQTDLAYMLILADLPNGFAFSIGPHLVTTRNGVYFRDDDCYCPPNNSGQLKWYKREGAQ